VRILVITQGQWGERIAAHLLASAPPDWQVDTWQGPTALPRVLDDPEDFVPDKLPHANLLLVLTESPGMTDLAPDLAQLCSAEAVIVPVDRRSWAPVGLMRQVRQRLGRLGIGGALPMPFCTLTPKPDQNPLIREFSRRYGRPKLVCTTRNGQIASCEVLREAPCGNTRYIAGHLPGVSTDHAAEQAGLLHHYYPCWGGMETDPVHGTHTLLHIAATMAQRSVERALIDPPSADSCLTPKERVQSSPMEPS
jgi:thymidylate synthase